PGESAAQRAGRGGRGLSRIRGGTGTHHGARIRRQASESRHHAHVLQGVRHGRRTRGVPGCAPGRGVRAGAPARIIQRQQRGAGRRCRRARRQAVAGEGARVQPCRTRMAARRIAGARLSLPAVADQFPVVRVAARCGETRTAFVRARGDRAADGGLRTAACAADQRRQSCGEPAPVAGIAVSARLDWIASPARRLRGEICVPGDKSISHRAIMLSALAEGTSRITGFLEGEDTRATARIFEQMGVRIEVPSPGERVVHGVGLRGLRALQGVLDCGNSGTAMRLLCGMMAGQAFESTLTGDASLLKRPMRRVTEPLMSMGASIEAAESGTPPLRVHGGQSLCGIDYASPIASAQVKSAVLLGGLYAEGETGVTEPKPTRDYTERMLRAFGWPVEFEPGRVRLPVGHTLRATDIAVPADFSSAAFFIVAAAIVPGSQLRLRGIGMNPRRTGLLHALRAMGANIAE